MLGGVTWSCERHDGQWWTDLRGLVSDEEMVERRAAVLDLCLAVIQIQSSTFHRYILQTATGECMLQLKGALSTVAEDVARVKQHRRSFTSPHEVWTARCGHDSKCWIRLAVLVYPIIQDSILLDCNCSKQYLRRHSICSFCCCLYTNDRQNGLSKPA